MSLRAAAGAVLGVALLLGCVNPRSQALDPDHPDASGTAGAGGTAGKDGGAARGDNAGDARSGTGGSPGTGGASGTDGPIGSEAGPACEPKSCVGDTLSTCGADGKVMTTPCPNGCNAVTLACNICRPNTRTCSGNNLVVCRADGSGTDSMACTAGCNTGTNECNGCQPGSTWCNGDVLRECTAAGAQRDRQTCAQGCNSTRLACNACKPGAKTCNGDVLETCNAEGSAATGATCPQGCDPARQACGACKPDTMRCSGSTLQACRADGSGWRDVASCGSKGCNGTRLACNVCQPGDKTCGGSILSTCRSDGSGTDETTCADGCRTDRPECLACSASEHVCGGECKSNTSPASCGTSCTPCPDVQNANLTCSSGKCGFTCNQGTVRCAGAEACEKLAWSFEVDNERWVSGGGDDSATSSYEQSSTRAHGGSGALKASINVSAQKYAARLSFFPCGGLGGSSFDVRNRTLSFWVYIESSNAPTDDHQCYGGGYAGPTPFGYDKSPPKFRVGQWAQTRILFDAAAASEAHFLGIDCRFNVAKAWTGTIYVDDIRLE